MQRITADNEISYIMTEKELKDIQTKTISTFINRFIYLNESKQMTKPECINAMFDLAEEMKGGAG